MATVIAPEDLLTAEEYSNRSDPGYPEELVRGRIVAMAQPNARHGEVCANTMLIVGPFVREHDLGRALCNDTGVITERGPDTVRGADIVFYSYARAPKGPLPKVYLEVMPELVFEVRSPSDRWSKVLQKVAEYLNAGVGVVCVLDDSDQTATVFEPDRRERELKSDDDLTFPDILPGFRVPVRRFFE